ncbi:MAG: adenylate/guanylate cyclase domain-containing protein [Pseudorhodobacter sp.]
MSHTARPRTLPRLWPTAAQARLWSGLLLFGFALTHLLNHALGLWSFEAMQAMQDARLTVTRSVPGTGLLVLAAGVHLLLGLGSFIRTRTKGRPLRAMVQLGLGLLIPMFLMRHVWDTRGAHELFGIEDSYAYALWGIWPNEGLNQALLISAVWGHGCIGLHHWLSGRGWYRRLIWLWFALAVLIPALSFAGFVTAARAFKLTGEYRNPFQPGQWDLLVERVAASELAYGVLIAGAVVLWVLLIVADRMRLQIAVSYPGGVQVSAPPGLSLLDISRMHRIPHASVCGGRARCSTCRVRVLEGLADLPPPDETERIVLARVSAPSNVRLACQLRPTTPLKIVPLLPGRPGSLQGLLMDRYHWGVEQDVTLLFADLRGFTRMSEGKLPFDVVFLLNQFLGQMAGAIEDTGGQVDKFMGDGIMAIYGMQAGPRQGAAAAIAGARAMGGVLSGLNQSLHEDLEQPLSMGIGLHSGPAILGRIGASDRAQAVTQLTALGETVNIASRLETATKDLGVQVIVSEVCMAASGLTPGPKLEQHLLELRGKSKPVPAWAAVLASDLPAPITERSA